MLIVYDKTTGEIIGHCSSIFHGGRWREPVTEEIFPNHDRSRLESISIADDARFIGYGRDAWRLKKDETGVVTGIERRPTLYVSCDAGDADGDGVPDLPADGKSVTVITAKTSDGGDVAITFRTTRGALDHRTAQTQGGVGTVRLRAADETVALTVTATAPGYRSGQIGLELTPVKASSPRAKATTPA